MKHSFSQCNTSNDIEKVLDTFVHDLGLPFYSYLLLRRSSESPTILDATFLNNYPSEWHKRYKAKRYHLQDPVCELSTRNRLPFTWGSDRFLRNFRKSQRIVFHESRNFQVKHGYSIPLSGPQGDLGVLSIAGPNERDLRDAIKSAGPTLQLNAIVAHDSLMNLLDTPDDSPVHLTPRERECLLWTSEGKTADDIATILSVSTSTVNYHLSNTIQKLNACNKHHAAIVAMRSGLL